jgi:UDP-glucose 4-epimerase
VIGRGSFLARSFSSRCGELALTAVSHRELDAIDFSRIDVVVNFALEPRYYTAPYSDEIDFDLAIAARIKKTRTHYLCLSTRRAYATADSWGASEASPARGDTQYGRNKVITETRLHDLLGARLTVVRLPNVIGYEYGGTRGRFMESVLNSLKRYGCIYFDMSPRTRREFLPDTVFADAMLWFVGARPAGIFNLGLGFAVEVGHIARWVLEGYGSGRLVIDDPSQRDEFYLDTTKLRRHFEIPADEGHLRHFCVQLGRRLADEKS